MKTFQVKFQNYHERLPNCYITLRMQAKDSSHLIPRIKKELKNLNALPNPKQHTEYFLTEIKELTKEELTKHG